MAGLGPVEPGIRPALFVLPPGSDAGGPRCRGGRPDSAGAHEQDQHDQQHDQPAQAGHDVTHQRPGQRVGAGAGPVSRRGGRQPGFMRPGGEPGRGPGRRPGLAGRDDGGGHLHRPGGVDGAVPGARGARPPGARGPGQRAADLSDGEVRVPGQDEGGHARHDAAGRAGGTYRRVSAGRDRRHQVNPRRGQRHVGVPAAERGELPVPGGRAHRDDPWVGGRVIHQAGSLAVVARRGHQDHVLAQRVRHGRPLGPAAAGRGRVAAAGQAARPRVQRQVDDPGAVIDRVGDAVGDGRGQPPGYRRIGVQRVVVFQVDPDGQDLRRGRDAEEARLAAGAVSVPRDDPRDLGPVNAPEGPGHGPARAGVVRSRRHGAGQVGMPGGDAGAEYGHGDTGSLGGPPRLPHVQAAQPPFLALDAGTRATVTRGGERRHRPDDPDEPGHGNCRS